MAIQLDEETIRRNLPHMGINWDSPKMARGPFYGPLFGFTSKKYENVVAQTVMVSSLAIGRKLEPSETDALAEISARRFANDAFYSPAYLVMAAGFTWRTTDKFGFPFYTPKPASFDPNVFPHKRIPWLTGQNAFMMWHGVRFSAYSLLTRLWVSPVLAFLNYSQFVLGMQKDTRLGEFRKDLDRYLKNSRKGLPERPDMSDGHQRSPPSPFSRPRGQQQQQQQQQQYQQQRPPQEEQFQEYGASAPSYGGSSPYPPIPAPTRTPHQQQQQSSSDDDDSYLFDDTSPVSPAARNAQAAASTSPGYRGNSNTGGGGSAWDRVRQQSASGDATGNTTGQAPASSWRQRQQQQQQQGEQYSYSQADEEKAYAKEQAQREFDAMLEREQRGQGESGGERPSSRW